MSVRVRVETLPSEVRELFIIASWKGGWCGFYL
nr:MAG TPA: hypothetical protein [Caudoviricetes sp.]